MKALRGWLSGLAAMCAAGTAIAAPHEGNIHVGVSIDGHLAAVVEQDHAQPLGASAHPDLHGWLGEAPAFEAIVRPDGDLEPIAEGADVNLELISVQPALRLYDHDLAEVLVGEHLHMGGAGFVAHGVYHIDSDDPAYNFDQGIWLMEFRLVDHGTTGYGDSPSYTLAFTSGCSARQKISATCRLRGDGAWQVVAKIKRGTPGAELTLRFEEDPNTDTPVELSETGKGKAKFPIPGPGHYHVEIVECGQTGHAECD